MNGWWPILRTFCEGGHALPCGQNRIDILHEAFRTSARTSSLRDGLMLLGLVALAVIIAQLIYHYYQHRTTRVICSPEKLFIELVKMHRLNGRQRKTLRKLASTRQLQDPCRLFVDSRLWIMDAHRDAKLLSSPKARGQLMNLQRVLFHFVEEEHGTRQ